MLSEEQKDQYISFVANFVYLLHEETNMTEEQALACTEMAASTLLGAVFHALPDKDEKMDAFVINVLEIAVKRAYGKNKHVHLN